MTRKFRERKIQDGPISSEWDMDDHMVALKARMSPLKAVGVGLLSAAIRVYRVLWPQCEPPALVDELTACLLTCEDRIDDWRSSAARVGADEALMYVLSWYEGIDLDALKTLHDGSKWTTDPDLIRLRQETAHSLIQYAPVHSFVAGPRVPHAEEVEADGDEEEDEEQVDEEITADTAPDTTIGTASATTIETQTAPSAEGTSDAVA